MSWITDWFTRDKFKIFVGLIVKAGKLFFGDISEDLYELATKHVRLAESSGKDGLKKYEMAFAGVSSELKSTNIPEYLINLFIESAVLVLNESLVQHKR